MWTVPHERALVRWPQFPNAIPRRITAAPVIQPPADIHMAEPVMNTASSSPAPDPILVYTTFNTITDLAFHWEGSLPGRSSRDNPPLLINGMERSRGAATNFPFCCHLAINKYISKPPKEI